jgi:acetyltransferase-like isoleucine patch superfamily enzyme
MNATILPGSCIGNDSVIGAGSLVNKTIDDHSMVVGIPGKVIRTGVNWDRRKDITYEEFCQQKGE